IPEIKTIFSVIAGRDGSRSFRGDHDDRWGNSYSNKSRGQRGQRNGRRGSFRNFNPGSSRYRNRPDNSNVDEDGDVAMGGDTSGGSRTQRYNPYGGHRSRGSNQGRGGRNRGGRQNQVQKSDKWFRIMVPFGASMTKEELFSLINSEIKGPFEPIKYSTDEKRSYFYLKGVDMAESLKLISRRITKPDGHKLIFHVSPSPPPAESTIDEAIVEKLKFRMSERYDPSSQVLNLSDFSNDDSLSKESIFLPLNRVSTMSAVTKIIGEHIPELSGLDVSNNKLLSLSHMADLVKAAPNVELLNLGHNQLRSIDELEKLKGWVNIVELTLNGNDFCSSYSNPGLYIRAVRKTFPKVVKLDGTVYPPPITFDLDTNLSLPVSKGSYLLNDEVQTLVVTFIKEFYSIYDSDRRRELMPAYHEKAQFSYSVVKNPLLERQVGLTNYLDDSRNLKIIGHYDAEKLSKKIKTGSLTVISCLENLPKTTHDINSFKVDVCRAIPTMLCFILQGVFKENESRSDKPVLRSFSRTFITVPSGPGMVIINDMLSISNASLEQTRNAFKGAAPTPSSSPVSSSQLPAASLSTSQLPGAPIVQLPTRSLSAGQLPSQPPVFLSTEQQQMVENFCIQSKMNHQFSLICLQDNGWDYQRAAQNFNDLHNQGKIPAEAFVKLESNI
ncbi:nuclear RNA export factor 1-like, partial [Physella acuta]|uniref:nuclear RNA export factor 1-like n=1 Tax=Physella acuta TaxID=109671 RepID=UPI0027DE3534